MNNLDPEVAERPAELVVYGGIGRAARNWECFDKIVEVLRRLKDDETLLVQSGKPVGVFPTHPDAPRGAARELEPRAALGDVGALPRTRPQGPDDVRPDDGRELDLHRHAGHRAGHLRDVRRGCRRSTSAATPAGRWILTGGLGGMGGAQPLAATMAGFSLLAVECDESAHRLPPAHALPRPQGGEPRRSDWRSSASEPGVSVGLLGNAADVCSELVARGITPDVVTDQTSAHDPLNGYLPQGWTLAEWRERAKSRPGRR